LLAAVGVLPIIAYFGMATHFPSTRRAVIRAISDHPAASLESLAETPIVSGTAQPADRCAVPVPSFASPK